MDWRIAINENEIDTENFIDYLVRKILSGKKRDEIISGIMNEYDGSVKPYKEALKQWEENLDSLSGFSEEELHREYNNWIADKLKLYDEILKENMKTMALAKKLLERISGVDVGDDFRDVFTHIKDEILSLTRRNEYIEEKKKNLVEGSLEYSETYEWFRSSKIGIINSRIRSIKNDISAYERIMKDKTRLTNKVFDELKL